MSTHHFQRFDPLLTDAQAHGILELVRRFGAHGMYSEEGLNEGIGEGLPQRYDSIRNFVNTGGRYAKKEEFLELVARTNYFRETYAYGEDVQAPGIEPFLHHEGFVEAARAIHGRPVIEPAIVFANMFVPGQELAVHTDVPEFRGANRKVLPEWLLVVMHHSGLFHDWRMPIATAVSWWTKSGGGQFVCYPQGPQNDAQLIEAKFNSAVILDTDTVFHGVDPVFSDDGSCPPLLPGMRLEPDEESRWVVREGDRRVAAFEWDELRYSISWKAYCFRDETERRTWRERSDDLSLDFILDTLEKDLRKRGRLDGPRPEPSSLTDVLIDTYIPFPQPDAQPSAGATAAAPA